MYQRKSSEQMFLKFRISDCWGVVEDLRDAEVRSYVDGRLRSFRYLYQTQGRPSRHMIRECFPTESDWDAFTRTIDRINIWDWDRVMIKPISDFPSWQLRIKNGDKSLRVEGVGMPEGFHEFSGALDRLGAHLD